ncbi:hypothetical protein PSYMP_16936 [Pseudomonas amygdali pv. morsprunorum str. M302280]|nr:hypothetical protein PSYMP_16936 [Pseudomonas amygdali pv. morsprunorum str. M302280]
MTSLLFWRAWPGLPGPLQVSMSVVSAIAIEKHI